MAGTCYFLGLGCLLLACCGPLRILSQALSPATFRWMRNSSYGTSVLGANWTVSSLTSCVMSCRAKYPSCYSVIHFNGTSTCTPGSQISYGVPVPGPTAGSRFYYTDFCNTTLGFQLFIYKSVVECLYVTKTSATFTTARAACAAKNARLMQAKTQDKFDLFLNIAKNTIRTFTYLGLTDIITEDNWMWEDGEPLNDTWKSTIFLPGDGTNNPIEDCAVTANYSKFKWVYDGKCELSSPAHYFICELII